MLLAPVAESPCLPSTLDVFHRDQGQQVGRTRPAALPAPSSTACEGHRHFQGGEHGPGVAFGEVDETRQRVWIGLEPLHPQGTLGSRESPAA